MTQKLEIGIDAKLNTQAVDQGVDGLNEKLNQASKTKLDPVSDQAIKKVNALGRGVDGVKKAAGAAGKTKFDPIPDSTGNLVNQDILVTFGFCVFSQPVFLSFKVFFLLCGRTSGINHSQLFLLLFLDSHIGI